MRWRLRRDRFSRYARMFTMRTRISQQQDVTMVSIQSAYAPTAKHIVRRFDSSLRATYRRIASSCQALIRILSAPVRSHHLA